MPAGIKFSCKRF